MTDQAREEVFEAVDSKRRDSVLRLFAAGAFVVPMMSSFAMKRLTLNGLARNVISGSQLVPLPPGG